MKIFSDGFFIEIISLSPDVGEAISRIIWIGLPSQAELPAPPTATPVQMPTQLTASPYSGTNFGKPVKRSLSARKYLPATGNVNTRNCTNEYNGAGRQAHPQTPPNGTAEPFVSKRNSTGAIRSTETQP